MELVLRPDGRQDAAVLAAIYNSNPEFLLHHLGRKRVDEAFLLSELDEMAGAGFVTLLVTQGRGGPALAAADVRGGEEAYLSLLILHRDAQGHGLGRQCAALLEEHLRASGSRRVRIDVVDDHPGNPLPFWQRMGYEGSQRVALTWGDKTSSALGYINEGNTATFLGKSSTDARGVKWYKIKYDGVTGWISSRYSKIV